MKRASDVALVVAVLVGLVALVQARVALLAVSALLLLVSVALSALRRRGLRRRPAGG